MDWYSKAADQGDTVGQLRVEYLYDLGLGVAKDYFKAIKWYHPVAQNHIGVLHRNSNGAPKIMLAVEWFLKAANQGYANSQCGVGDLFEHGYGVPQDFPQVLKWYLKAADQGLAHARFSVGYFYGNGHGARQDYSQAVNWYLKAASQGHTRAQYNIDNALVWSRCTRELYQGFRMAPQDGQQKIC
ncbi:hypothetical protein BG015_007931 [Linnemannia schmuckeri]|uniref:HCP-like protein n=1 Tax=Linnemannia schmuckeri TaxID=64567 RepID=A0A9P5RY92_9FUNG|nr:hypothetical protein BG015_007931 [Linnemannia schmuckeri]